MYASIAAAVLFAGIGCACSLGFGEGSPVTVLFCLLAGVAAAEAGWALGESGWNR